MKAKIILDGRRPKVSYGQVSKVVRESGVTLSRRQADIGIVVGGDGVFSRVGSLESVPLLFVGQRSSSATGSKAYLAAVQFDELGDALGGIAAGRYRVTESRRLAVLKNGRRAGVVFTDVYVQRGMDSNCIRYRTRVTGRGVDIDEAAIGDGVVITTAAGSTGYYSYLDRMKGGELDPAGHARLRGDRVGVCHILPTYVERKGSSKRPIRYDVPWGATIRLSITRQADARLYGLGGTRAGIRLSPRDTVTVVPSPETTKVIALR